MGFFKSISKAIYKEYDRRIKRASLITEYGASHHDDHAPDHSDDAHAEDAHEHDGATEAEIVNIPRGTPVAASAPPAEQPAQPPKAEP